jgi:Transglycosylase associated protein.
MNLSVEGLIVLLVVAGLVGAIGQRLAGRSRGGLITSIALGFFGAFLGAWAARQFRLPEIYTLHVGNTSFPIVWSIIGAALLVALLGLLTRRRYL